MFRFWRLSWLVCCCLLLSLAACDSGNQPAQSATPPSVASTQSVPYTLQISPKAMNAPIVGTVPDNTSIPVTLTFKVNQSLLKQSDSGENKSSTSQTSGNSLQQLGLDAATYQQIKSYFEKMGVTVKTDASRLDISLQAKAGLISKLLQTPLVYRKLHNRTFYTPKSATLHLPKVVVDHLQAITGLDNYSQAPKSATSASAFVPVRRQTSSQSCGEMDPNTLNPQQVAHAYGLDSLLQQGWTGKGMTINLIELEAFDQDAVQHYLDCVGYNGQLKVINVDTPPTFKGDEIEALLDIEMIASLAPDININVYQTTGIDGNSFWNGFRDELKQIAVDNQDSKNPGYISISWLGSEAFMSEEFVNSFAPVLQTLKQNEHMTIFSASGDCGPYGQDGDKAQLSVNFPASSSWNVAVGGTVLNVDGNGNRSSEVAWRAVNPDATCNNTWGSGGGNSALISRPAWQDAPGLQNKYSNDGRQVPDVAAVATNLAAYFQGQWGYVYGTSAATPITATIFALMNQKLINQTHYYTYGPSLFYYIATAKNSHAYYDVQQGQGNDMYYPVTPGWDYTTGLGVPNVANFYNALVQFVRKK